jgi:hypothetical protein
MRDEPYWILYLDYIIGRRIYFPESYPEEGAATAAT